MPEAIDHARELIQSRLAELDTEAKDLERALVSLGEKVARRSGRPRKASAVKHRRKTGGRAPRGQRREQLLAAIKANPGARPAELAREVGISANQVHGLIKKARAEKLVVKKGKGYALKG